MTSPEWRDTWLRHPQRYLGPVVVGVVCAMTNAPWWALVVLCVTATTGWGMGYAAGWHDKVAQVRPLVDGLEQSLRQLGVPIRKEDA